MPDLTRDTLERITGVLENITYGAALIGAVAGILYMMFNKPLKKIEADEAQADRAAIAAADARGAEANKVAAEARERTVKLEIEAAEARERQVLAETKLESERIARLKIEERLAPRRLSPEQSTRLLHLLNQGPKGPVIVTAPIGNEEAHNFALELDRILKSAGWPSDTERALFKEGDRVGLHITVRSKTDVPPFAETLRRAIEGSGFSTTGGTNPTMTSGFRLQLIVAAKP